MAKKKKSPFPDTTKAGFSTVGESDVPDYIVAELKYESPVAYTSTKFVAPSDGAPQADSLNKVLSNYSIAKIGSLFGLKSKAIKDRIAVASGMPKAPSARTREARNGGTEFVQSGFLQIVPKNSKDAAKIARALNRNRSIYKAYVAPRPTVAMPAGAAPGSRNFEPAQGYLYDAPDGIGAEAVWPLAGAKGQRVTVCDIEGNWNLKHEDLPKGIKLLGGTPIPNLGWRNHGTAVLGEMVAVPNKFGCVGICHKAKAAVQSAVINGVFNTAGAINNAASKLKKGDVILIELHAIGPNGKFVAMQFWPDVFAAIKAATKKGITVVEAAGNGNENFDLPIYNGTGLQKDSGAIVVGAGIPPSNHFDFDNSYTPIGVPRSRIWFSNYGKIVDVQGWGWHVTTLGYGDAQGGPENKWYSLRFSGTSSASPIVTGAVAVLQGHSKAKNGSPLTPGAVRKILKQTGTKQVPGPGVPLSQKIGPLPNLVKAIKKV